MPRLHTFLPLLLGASLAFVSFATLSCNGNGGSSDAEGEIYTGGGTGSVGSSSGGGAGYSSSGGNIGAIDILEMSNAGNTDGIVAVFQPATSTGGDETPGARTVVLNAAAIGMPSDGTATLSITGRGVNYTATATVDADGNVTFEVPAIATGTEVTVALVIKTSGGAVLYSGSKTQVLTGDASSLNISLARQYWAMPASIGATASPDTLEYDPATLDSDSTTFSVIGLSDAPAGVSYSWTDESGTVVGTGATLTRTTGEMLGAGFTPSAASEERTYTVTVSYTDATGTAATLTASATATIVTTATIRLTASGIQSEGGRQFIVIPKTASSVPITAEVLFFAGTPTYTWSNVGVGFSSFVPAGGDSNNIGGPWDGGTSTITVTADLGDGRILTKELDVYVLEVRISGADVPSAAADPIVLEKAAGVSTVLTASLWETGSNLAGLSGVDYTWDVDDIAVATASPADGTSTTITPVGTGSTTVKATVTYKGVSVEATRTLVAIALRITSTGSFVYKWDPAMATQTMNLTVALDGVPSAEAGSVTYMTGDYGSSDMTVATVAAGGTPSGTSIAVTIAKGGLATIHAKATYGGKTFTAEQEITVLHLVLGGSGLHTVTTGTPPTTRDIVLLRPRVMDGTTEVAPAVPADLEMTLEGLTADSYEWESTTPTRCTVSPANTASTTVSPADTTATGYVNAKATYNGEEISVLQEIRMAALRLNGGGYILLDHSDPTDPGLNRRQFNLVTDGLTTSDLASASITYESLNPALATVVKGGTTSDSSSLPATSCLVTGLDAGIATIKVTATETLTGTNMELFGIKKVTVLDLIVKDSTGALVPATVSTLKIGDSESFTAELKGPPAGSDISYGWEIDSAGVVSLSPVNAATTTITCLSGGVRTVTVTATYDGVPYVATITCDVPYNITFTDKDSFAAAMAALPPNTADTAYRLEVTGLTDINIGAFPDGFGYALEKIATDSGGPWYVDLSPTDLTGLTNLRAAFQFAYTMVAAPAIPEGVTDMAHCFNSCTSLKHVPEIPSTVISMNCCFANPGSCPSIEGNIVVKSSNVADWEDAFEGIPSGVTVWVPDYPTRAAVLAANPGITVQVGIPPSP